MHDQADVAADAHRPEVLVPRVIQLVEAQSGIGRIDLKVERRGLDRLLLVARQAGEAVGEGVGDAEVHRCDQPSEFSQSTFVSEFAMSCVGILAN